MKIQLRDVQAEDLHVFYEQQLEPLALHMAAFTSKDPSDKKAFMDHWLKILGDNMIIIKTIVSNDGNKIVGHILSYRQDGNTEISYWIGKKHWGQGIATQALFNFLNCINERPLHARVAIDNLASIRILEKTGFKKVFMDKGYANARGKEINEYVLKLD